jgi:hypothetical protein
MWDDDDDDIPRDYLSKRKRLAPRDKHIMNTGERRELARLQQKSGKTEEELRKDIGVRRKLAAASKGIRRPAGKPSKKVRAIRHEAAAQLGTHINDPRVIPLADQLYHKRYDMWGRPKRQW